MRSSCAVLGNLGDGRSGMEFRAVVHFMEAASKKYPAIFNYNLDIIYNYLNTPKHTAFIFSVLYSIYNFVSGSVM